MGAIVRVVCVLPMAWSVTAIVFGRLSGAKFVYLFVYDLDR